MESKPGADSKQKFIAWIKLPGPEETRKLGLPSGYNFGFVGAMGRLLVSHPKIGPAFNKLFGQIMFGPGALNRQEREMVAMVTARAQDCFY